MEVLNLNRKLVCAREGELKGHTCAPSCWARGLGLGYMWWGIFWSSALSIMAMFASLIIRLFQLVFLAGTVFFSRNKISRNSVLTYFFSEANGLISQRNRDTLHINILILLACLSSFGVQINHHSLTNCSLYAENLLHKFGMSGNMLVLISFFWCFVSLVTQGLALLGVGGIRLVLINILPKSHSNHMSDVSMSHGPKTVTVSGLGVEKPD